MCARLISTLAATIVLFFNFVSPGESRPVDGPLQEHLNLVELEGRGWLPEPSQKLLGVILCVHGFGLNASSYEEFAERVTGRGFAVFALDARGFGHWRTKNKHPKLDLEQTVVDTEGLLSRLKHEFPGLPVFLLGESMGGAIALTTAARCPDQLDGVIASVPAADRFGQKASILPIATRLLFAPDKEFDVSRKVVEKAVSSEQLRHRWKSEPQNRLHLSAKELLQFQSFMNNATKLAPKIAHTPVLIVQGCRDDLVKPKATVRLYNSIPCKDKKLLLVGEAEHLIFQKGRLSQMSFDMILAWLRNHSGPQTEQVLKTSRIIPD